MILRDGIVLYHASYIEVKKVDFSLCADGKDFGKGFYLTTDHDQAVKFVKTAVRKAIKNGIIIENPSQGFISSFQYSKKDGVSIYEFNSAGKDWLHYVVGHRRRGYFIEELERLQDCDIIAGKIANDDTNRVITAYLGNAYGEIGTERADVGAVQQLKPNQLSNQICFRTENSLQCLSFIKSFLIDIGG